MERDKFLTEYFGECWHEWDAVYYHPWEDEPVDYRCKKCNILMTTSGSPHNGLRNFSSWTGFGWLWEKCQEQKWWEELNPGDDDYIPIRFVNPNCFADEVYEFLKESNHERQMVLGIADCGVC